MPHDVTGMELDWISITREIRCGMANFGAALRNESDI